MQLRDGSTKGRLLGVWEFAQLLVKGPGFGSVMRAPRKMAELREFGSFRLDRKKGSRAGRPVDRKVIHRLLTVIGEFGSLRA
jgi:hypothetical protein